MKVLPALESIAKSEIPSARRKMIELLMVEGKLTTYDLLFRLPDLGYESDGRAIMRGLVAQGIAVERNGTQRLNYVPSWPARIKYFLGAPL